jgi:lysophospholipase L1-like esterase
MQIIKGSASSTPTPSPTPIAATSKKMIATGGHNSINLSSDPADNNCTYVVRHTCRSACVDVQLMWINYYASSGDNVGSDPVTIKSSIVYEGSVYPISFNGRRSVVIDPGTTVTSDSIGVEMKEGDIFYTRTFVSVPEGGKFPQGYVTTPAKGEGKTAGDVVDSATGHSTNVDSAFNPIVIIGTEKTPRPSVLLMGSSTMEGAGDSFDGGGFGERAFSEFAWTNISRGGESAYHNTSVRKQFRAQTYKYATHAVIYYGSNDIGGTAVPTIKANFQAIWDALAARGIKVWHCTINPKPNVSEGVQTINTTVEQRRQEINTWLKTLPAPLTGCLDVNVPVEDSSNPGLWKPEYLADGTHTNQAGQTAIANYIKATYIDTGLFK